WCSTNKADDKPEADHNRGHHQGDNRQSVSPVGPAVVNVDASRRRLADDPPHGNPSLRWHDTPGHWICQDTRYSRMVTPCNESTPHVVKTTTRRLIGCHHNRAGGDGSSKGGSHHPRCIEPVIGSTLGPVHT